MIHRCSCMNPPCIGNRFRLPRMQARTRVGFDLVPRPALLLRQLWPKVFTATPLRALHVVLHHRCGVINLAQSLWVLATHFSFVEHPQPQARGLEQAHRNALYGLFLRGQHRLRLGRPSAMAPQRARHHHHLMSPQVPLHHLRGIMVQIQYVLSSRPMGRRHCRLFETQLSSVLFFHQATPRWVPAALDNTTATHHS